MNLLSIALLSRLIRNPEIPPENTQRARENGSESDKDTETRTSWQAPLGFP